MIPFKTVDYSHINRIAILKEVFLMLKVFEFAPEGNISLRNKFLKLKRPFRNTNTGQKALSFIDLSFWNQIPETLKKIDNLNTFKHNLKKHFFNQMT